MPDQESIETLMALEGNARMNYYGAWDTILGNEDFRFEKRTIRSPQKPHQLAHLLTATRLMYTTCLTEIYRTHLDPRISFSTRDQLPPLRAQPRLSRNLQTHYRRPSHLYPGEQRDGSKGQLSERILVASSSRTRASAKQLFLKAYDTRLKDTLKIPRLETPRLVQKAHPHGVLQVGKASPG